MQREAGGGYSLVIKDPNQQKDLTGFRFRKDLCNWRPGSNGALSKVVQSFASRYPNIENISSSGANNWTVKFGTEEYLLIPQMGGGYAGEFGLDVMHLPNFS